MTRSRMALIAGGLVVAAVAGVFGARMYRSGPSIAPAGDTTRAPQGQRVTVEVLNGSGTVGLAKRVTFLLRDRGFDVVHYNNDPDGRRSVTLIRDFTNKPEAAERLARVLGGAKIERTKDPLDRGLDLSVKIGASYKPVAELFHP
jgi:LytR cell envelope-related transcriptional attenuator